jgi:hypothetical protein
MKNLALAVKKVQLLVAVTTLALILTIGWGVQANAQDEGRAFFVQAEAAQGFAAPGNTQPANFLVVVTNHRTGAPVANLTESNFAIINHFSIPGQLCGFSNQIAFFHNIGTGAYQIRVELPDILGCAWIQGDYLAQIIVNEGFKRGQATATLSIK